jgi:DNA-binding MarR family transcriptional regulator
MSDPDDPTAAASASSTAPRAGADDVAELVREVYRQATAIAAGLGQATGIHPTDVNAMRVLDAATGRPTMSELGRTLGLSSAAVTGLVDRLEQAGLARRVRADDDRRRVHVEVTERAHGVAASHLAPLMGRIRRAVDEADPEHLPAIARFLRTLLEPDRLEPDRPAVDP